jgi:predicted DNA-binding transcriptional regulator AlpA
MPARVVIDGEGYECQMVAQDIASDETGRSLTIPEFCKLERLSKATFYNLKKRGLAPAVLAIPGSNIRRITAAARAEWYARMRELAGGEAAQLEHERRRELTATAGKLAAQSPNHMSRRRVRSASARRGRR